MTYKLTQSTIRDFGGGWDVSDSDKSLSSKYQPVSDNIVRQTDGSFSIRPGSRLFADMKQGVVSAPFTGVVNVTTTAGSGLVKINKTAHGLVNGNHINITAWTPPVGTVGVDDVLGSHGVRLIDANNFYIYVRKAGITAAGPTAVTVTYTTDTHIIGGSDIFGRYYKDAIFVFSDTGEIVKIDSAGTITAVWNTDIAQGKAPPVVPWSNCQRVSAEIVKGHLLAVNGATNDKPLDIFTNASGVTTCNYLVNETVDNTAIPRADFIIATDRYVLMVSTDRVNGPTTICISAKDTYYVFTGDPNPDDAVDIDIGMVTSAVETTILGANVIRNKVFIALHDQSILGELGIYTGDFHTPEFKDNVAMLGSYSHSSIISLGNDIFCAAINGVNSLEISRSSGEFTPTTISDLIHPVMLRHIARLTETDRRYKSFAVWDTNFRSYMLFMPKYSAVSGNGIELPDNPVIVSSMLQPYSLMYLMYPSHILDAGDYVTISGFVNSPDGFITAAMMNRTHRVRAVVDEDTVVLETPAYPTGLNYSCGGINCFLNPVNDETPAYVFEYNARLKIRRWTRFRGMNFRWGAVSQLSRLYFGDGNGRIYKYGNALDKYPADKIGDYNKRVWANSTAYVVGDRILDSSYRQVYIVLVAHTTAAAGTFKAYRDAHPTYFTEYTGTPIDWELETSWTDLKDRMANKQIEVVRFDTNGSSEFEFSIYTNSIQTDWESWLPIPRRTTLFIGEDAPGFGAGMQPYGGGRNTRQEWLRGMPVEGKLFRLRWAGSSVKPLTVSAATFYYHKRGGALT